MSYEQITGDDGKATFNVEYGDYVATISKDGYTTKTQTIAFRSNHKNFTINLENATPTNVLSLTWDASEIPSISALDEDPMTQEPLTGFILSDGASALIDWGDDTEPTVFESISDFNHTYTDTTKEYTVTVSVSDGYIVGLDGFLFVVVSEGELGVNTALTSITLPSSITSIGMGCFGGCSGLTSITLPSSITSLGENCFSGCSGLTSITLPSSITSLGEGCFSGCSGLTSITLPSSITSLGDYCFRGCSGLTSITLPSSITSIGDYCFDDCSGLTSINLYWIGQQILTYNYDWSMDNAESITIPNGTTNDYESAEYPSQLLTERSA